MILRRLLLGLAAAAALSASAAVCVVALAFALYALVEPSVGRAGAAAIVAGPPALIIALTAAFIGAAARSKARKQAGAAGQPVERLMRLVREKPVMAISAALGAGFLAVRNPRYLGAAIRAFFEGEQVPARRRSNAGPRIGGPATTSARSRSGRPSRPGR